VSDDLGNTDVTPRWKPTASVGGIGRPKRRQALNVSSARKQEIRAAKCRYCRLCDSTQRVQAHHLVPRGMGGTIGGEWTESNIVGLCRDCHTLVERRNRPACHLLRALLSDAEYSYVRTKMGEDWLDRRYPVVWEGPGV
jgi:5-methylcytosine-specific restriction endonuclease McrA